MLAALLFLAFPDPTLEQAQACRAHMELFIEDVARESENIAGPTWFIRDWWNVKAEEAGAPDDDGQIVGLIKTRLTLMRTDQPERFDAERQDCIDTAIDGGAVPGMGPE
ncbi:hypothetical protein N0B44_33270 [Roseibacterium beibuensis]|uniref:hypothetical protein n=1 Tax=[Roseibacterium] beibuensis TaxID=1193142 RepID=UPI00217D572E|nr:hypothetical protein [Roseibacterium beibuensis]MCS6627785.1 hypothetical protein [Roseibacterium beibuensis]